jgi:hypothetical protein
MGIGHLGASFALRARFPRISLFLLLLAPILMDLLCSLTILSGIESARVDRTTGSAIPLVLEKVPYTHSLVAGIVWGALAALVWWLFRRDRTGALVLGALVLSHWVLDVVSHLPDVPLFPAGPLLGLGLWRSRSASMIVEIGIFAGGLAIYFHQTRPRDRLGRLGVFIYVALLLAVTLGAFLGPPPPSIAPVAASNLALFFLLLFIEWVDRHREIARPSAV